MNINFNTFINNTNGVLKNNKYIQISRFNNALTSDTVSFGKSPFYETMAEKANRITTSSSEYGARPIFHVDCANGNTSNILATIQEFQDYPTLLRDMLVKHDNYDYSPFEYLVLKKGNDISINKILEMYSDKPDMLFTILNDFDKDGFTPIQESLFTNYTQVLDVLATSMTKNRDSMAKFKDLLTTNSLRHGKSSMHYLVQDRLRPKSMGRKSDVGLFTKIINSMLDFEASQILGNTNVNGESVVYYMYNTDSPDFVNSFLNKYNNAPENIFDLINRKNGKLDTPFINGIKHKKNDEILSTLKVVSGNNSKKTWNPDFVYQLLMTKDNNKLPIQISCETSNNKLTSEFLSYVQKIVNNPVNIPNPALIKLITSYLPFTNGNSSMRLCLMNKMKELSAIQN